MALTNREKRIRVKRRVRKNIFGTQERPRLSVYRSNKEIYAQLIDDNSGKTLIAASSRDKEIANVTATKVEISVLVGKKLAELAVKAGLGAVVFDRNGFIYHGRVKALADGAREAGLKF